ncbi:MAG: N-acyl-D-amino-acid deacylase family protein [Candidatus Binataceae bacterium]
MAAKSDLVIRNASIFDGSGAASVRADIAINGERIAAVGRGAGAGAVEIDARGGAVAPGFIDVHSHDDFAVFATPEMDFKVMQGVTTDVVGNCGWGAAPRPQAIAMLGALHVGSRVPQWDGYAGYLDAIDRNPASLNVAVLVGHGTVRLAAMGNAKRNATEAEIGVMRAFVREGIAAGAAGFSTGLIYEPGRYAATEEVIALTSEMRGGTALYASHMRDEAGGLLDSVRETIRIGEEAGVAVQISHHKASGQENWGRVRESLGLIEAARARGLDVTADQYPYTAGSTHLGAVIQNGALDDGPARGGLGKVPADKLLFAATPKHPEWEGLTLAAFCERWNLPARAAAERVASEESAGAVVIVELMDEADVRTVMRHPTTMIGSDGIPAGDKPHPRLYATFPRVLGHYARDEKVLTLAEAIYRMTGMPARKFHLADRGFVREGFFADLVIFDPARIADTATYEDPRRYPDGLSHVIVNGTVVARNGQHTGARPGRGLRRAQSAAAMRIASAGLD